MNNIHLSVVTADGTAIDKAVSYVNIPTAAGSIGVLSGHASMICAVKKGLVRYSIDDDSAGKILVGDGIADVNWNEVTLLVSSVMIPEE